MARVAEDILRQEYPNVPITIEVVKEEDHKTVGNGTGIMYVVFPRHSPGVDTSVRTL